MNEAKPVYSNKFTIGPLWLDSLAIKLGTVRLNAHKGSKRCYKVKNGTKVWKKYARTGIALVRSAWRQRELSCGMIGVKCYCDR